MIVLMAGLPGTGKTTLARELSARVSGAILSKDVVRHALFASEDVEYSTGQDDFCMEVMLQTAEYLLRRNPRRTVFLDGRTFSRGYQIERVLTVASSLDQAWRILECVCSDETAKRRLEAQVGEHPGANRNFELYTQVKTRFEPIARPKTVIDTDQPLEACIKQGMAALL
jgi:predicted kinase